MFRVGEAAAVLKAIADNRKEACEDKLRQQFKSRSLGPRFKRLAHRLHEAVGVCAVEDAVVEGETGVCFRPNSDHPVNRHNPILNHANTQNAGLRLINNRRRKQTAKHTMIRNRKRAALHIGCRQLLATGPFSQ